MAVLQGKKLPLGTAKTVAIGRGGRIRGVAALEGVSILK